MSGCQQLAQCRLTPLTVFSSVVNSFIFPTPLRHARTHPILEKTTEATCPTCGVEGLFWTPLASLLETCALRWVKQPGYRIGVTLWESALRGLCCSGKPHHGHMADILTRHFRAPSIDILPSSCRPQWHNNIGSHDRKSTHAHATHRHGAETMAQHQCKGACGQARFPTAPTGGTLTIPSRPGDAERAGDILIAAVACAHASLLCKRLALLVRALRVFYQCTGCPLSCHQLKQK